MDKPPNRIRVTYDGVFGTGQRLTYVVYRSDDERLFYRTLRIPRKLPLYHRLFEYKGLLRNGVCRTEALYTSDERNVVIGLSTPVPEILLVEETCLFGKQKKPEDEKEVKLKENRRQLSQVLFGLYQTNSEII